MRNKIVVKKMTYIRVLAGIKIKGEGSKIDNKFANSAVLRKHGTQIFAPHLRPIYWRHEEKNQLEFKNKDERASASTFYCFS